MKLIPINKSKINKYYIAYPIIVLVVLIFYHSIGQYYLWDMNLLSLYQTDGTALTFTGLFRQYIEDRPEKPENYSIKKLENLSEIFAEDAKEELVEDVITPQNVIMIMNESFADLSVGGSELANDIIPYYLSLDNTIRGNLYVSVRGGGTCNSEYETLTGNSTAFFAGGVYPYNMYMSREVPSLVAYFNSQGYNTTGMHLGKSTNWNRKAAYEKLEFQNTIFAETFDGIDTVHGFPTDKENYDRIIQLYEDHKDEKNFIFNVTYQNHGGYLDSNDLVKTVDLSWRSRLPKLENYLSLMKRSDQEFQYLIEYFKQVEEPTMIIMYGDHQPSLGYDSDYFLFPRSGQPETDLKKYITPFVIWANYDIEDKYIEKLSANYLSSYILKAGNFEMTPYQEFLYQLSNQYPVITLYGCLDSRGEFYNTVNDLQGLSIEAYRAYQYNNVFDRNRKKEFFYIDAK